MPEKATTLNMSEMFAMGMRAAMENALPVSTESQRIPDDELIANFFEFANKNAREQAAHRYGSLAAAVEKLSSDLSLGKVGQAISAEALAGLGLEGTMELFKTKISNPGDRVGPYIIRGFKQALEEFPDTHSLKSKMVEAMAPMFARKYHTGEWDTHNWALEWDETKAVKAMLGTRCWRVENPALHCMLRAMTQRRVRLPVGKIQKLLATLPDKTRTRMWSYAALLDCYALVSPIDAEPLIRAALNWKWKPEEGVISAQDELTQALCTAKGLFDPYQTISLRWEKLTFSKLAPIEQQFMAVLTFYYAWNGDLSSFLEDRIAEMWHPLRDGLAAIGAPKFVALFDAWAKVIPGVKPGAKDFDYSDACRRFEKKTGRFLDSELETISKAMPTECEADIQALAYMWLTDNSNALLESWKTT